MNAIAMTYHFLTQWSGLAARRLRGKFNSYLRLIRFDKPVGTLLLWFPTAWALWIANQGVPSVKLLVLFFLGTFCMRSAGCIINDMADRHIDKHVTRTRERPLTTGEVSLFEAFILLFVLLMVALFIVFYLPHLCLYYAFVAVLITILYPFCKRFFEAPQMVLGLAFSMGIPMAYVASNVSLDKTTLILFILNFIWIVAYDTLYAMVDREDDLRIGVKSTAVLFANHDSAVVLFLHLLLHSLWLLLGVIEQYTWLFYGCWLIGFGNLAYQQWLMRRREAAAYFKSFLTNVWYGSAMWLGLILQFQ